MSRNQRRKLLRAQFNATKSTYISDVAHYPTKPDSSVRAQAHVSNCRMAGLNLEETK